jgi:hypothetical protein
VPANECDLASISVAPDFENLFELRIGVMHFQFLHMVIICDLRQRPKPDGRVGNG